MITCKYAHTNLIARDWRSLADFYIRVLGCTPVLPERHLHEPWLAASTSIPGARLDGMHLRLPGDGDSGPTLELFQYQQALDHPAPAANRPGFGHLAFVVEDVHQAREEVLSNGGGLLGETVSVEIPQAGTITFVYVTDPEGNILELQKWAQVPSKG
jgi:catechol 2,3-dioxygenase-like lactoylglutathione lyase family enzyme